MTAQTLIFIAFFLGFAIKIPMFPVHTWLPDAHTEAPAGGSVILGCNFIKAWGLRIYSFFFTNCSRCLQSICRSDGCFIFDCCSLYWLYRNYSKRYETTNCLFINFTYGICDFRLFCHFCYCQSNRLK